MKGFELAALGCFAVAGLFAACEQQPTPTPAMSPVSVQHEPEMFGDSVDESGEPCECAESGQLVHSSGY